MTVEQTPSSGGSVTPTPDTPVTGTPASPGVTPAAKKPVPTLEEALRTIAELEHSQVNAREAEDRLGKKLAAFEKAEREQQAAKKAADEATLSEVERLKKQHADIQAERDALALELQKARVVAAIGMLAQKLHLIDPDATATLLDWKAVEYDDGRPTNIEKLLQTLIKNKPYLAPEPAPPPAQAPATPAQTASQVTPPVLPVMNQGRSNIPAPGSTTPGRPPSLSDAFPRPQRP